jgi:predicted nucleic acid-binding protein
VIVLDAQALIAALVGEPATDEVERILRDPGDPAVISSVNLAEVIYVLVRSHGNGLEDVRERIDWLLASSLSVRDVDVVVALLAGELRSRHYHRTQRPLSLADCIALATAITDGGALATADPALADTARERSVAVHALPDARGARP